MNQGVAVLVVLIALALVSLILVPRWRMKRAVSQVIKIFRKHEATHINNARTIDQLGLKPRSFLEGMFRGRDYKPYAFQALLRGGIVLETEDGRYYISEDKLATTSIRV